MALHKDLTGADLHVNKVHADTHVVAGTDPLTLAESQVTNLTTDLSGKVSTGDARLSDARTPVAHTHPESDVTSLATDLAAKIPKSIMTAKGSIIVATAAGTPAELLVGAEHKVPTAQADGSVAWETPAAGGGSVTAVTGTSPIVSSEGTTPAISIPAATNAAAGHATAAQILALEAATAAQHAAATIGTGNGLSIEGQAISLAAATASVPGAATAAQITKLDGIAAGAKVGDVVGPDSVTADHIVQFNATTGKLVKDGGVLGTMAAAASADYIANAILTAHGDLIYATGSATPAILAHGAEGTVLTIASSLPSWVAHPNHIPATGASAQILQYTSSGAAKWITLSGDLTIADGGAITIGANKITLAMLATQAAETLLANATASAAVPAALALAEQTVLGRITGGHIVGLTVAQIQTLLSITAAGAAILDDATAADQRTTLGAMASAAGTVTLAQMANMATASLVYRKTAGAGAPEVNTLATLKTDLGLTGSNSGDQTLSSLGIPNVDNTSDATKNAAAVTVTNHRFTRRVDTQTHTDTITPEISTYDIFIRSAQQHALVINNHSSSTPVDGDMMLFEILSDGTAHGITYGNMYVAKAGVALPSTTVISKNLTMLFIWRNDLTQWVLLSAGQEA